MALPSIGHSPAYSCDHASDKGFIHIDDSPRSVAIPWRISASWCVLRVMVIIIMYIFNGPLGCAGNVYVNAEETDAILLG